MHWFVNELKRCLINLHLSLNDLLRRSVDLMRSAYTNHYQTKTIRRNRNSNKIVLSGTSRFQSYRPFKSYIIPMKLNWESVMPVRISISCIFHCISHALKDLYVAVFLLYKALQISNIYTLMNSYQRRKNRQFHKTGTTYKRENLRYYNTWSAYSLIIKIRWN